jgi:prevent-host-death family protein
MTSWRQKQIGAGEFKAKCLQLMDEVQREGIELIITKRGKPVAKLVPADVPTHSAIGCMKGTMRIVGDIVTSDPSEWSDDDE